MNILIIIAFLAFIASIIVLLYPKQCVLMLGYVNKYDIETIPFKYVRRLYLFTVIIMITSLIVLYYEIGMMQYPEININWDFFTTIFG